MEESAWSPQSGTVDSPRRAWACLMHQERGGIWPKTLLLFASPSYIRQCDMEDDKFIIQQWSLQLWTRQARLITTASEKTKTDQLGEERKGSGLLNWCFHVTLRHAGFSPLLGRGPMPWRQSNSLFYAFIKKFIFGKVAQTGIDLIGLYWKSNLGLIIQITLKMLKCIPVIT